MVVQKPTDEQIQSADIITFFDPNRPGFYQIVIDAVRYKKPPRDLDVIDIPVDSTKLAEVDRLRDRIKALRPPK